VKLLQEVGFEGVEVQRRFDCFAGTSKEKTALKYGVRGVNVIARKPGSKESR
jgi:hypothetical protein